MPYTWTPDNFNGKLRKENERRMLDSILVVENKAKRRCPKKTSRLASSLTHWIGVQFDFLSAYAIAGGRAADGTNVFYAIYVELGTKYFIGFFYMRGALRESYPIIKRIWGIK